MGHLRNRRGGRRRRVKELSVFLATENFLNNQGNRYDANWNNTDSTERVLNFIKSRTAEA